jgi:hypothetical protein
MRKLGLFKGSKVSENRNTKMSAKFVFHCWGYLPSQALMLKSLKGSGDQMPGFTSDKWSNSRFRSKLDLKTGNFGVLFDFCCFLRCGLNFIDQAGIELVVLLPQPIQSWDYRCEAPCLAPQSPFVFQFSLFSFLGSVSLLAKH